MAYVYILKSLKNGKFYIGSTLNIEERVKKHNNGYVYYTKRNLPFELVFKQEYPSLAIARKIEYRLKRFKRRDFIEKIIQEGRIRIT